MTLDNAKQEIFEIFEKINQNKITKKQSDDLTDGHLIDSKDGKFYEAWVLAHFMQQLYSAEQFTFQLSTGSHVKFKAKGGPLNYDFPYFKAFNKSREHIGNIFTDIEFLGLSAVLSSKSKPSCKSDIHELDIVFCSTKVKDKGYPKPREIFIGIECKAMDDVVSKKQYLKSILGIRRELSFMQLATEDNNPYGGCWPNTQIDMDPAVFLMFYSKDANVGKEWASAQEAFDINFEHLDYN